MPCFILVIFLTILGISSSRKGAAGNANLETDGGPTKWPTFPGSQGPGGNAGIRQPIPSSPNRPNYNQQQGSQQPFHDKPPMKRPATSFQGRQL